MTDEQYEFIKEYVIDRLPKPVEFTHTEFVGHFSLEPPYYRELVERVKNDGMPFYTQGFGGVDGNGDPAGGGIIFSTFQKTSF